MRSHVDWITFTFSPLYPDGTFEGYTMALADGLIEMFGQLLWDEIFDGEWNEHGHGRAPYSDNWTLAGRGIRLFASPTLSHSCCEISGEGCEWLISTGNMERVLKQCASRVTRIDVATDIETSTRPSEFVEQISNNRITARGYQSSSTGETCYVGSQKSDRYARVYRYEPPHPRSHLLRVECVFRRGEAKSVAMAIVNSDVNSVSASAGNVFGWTHRDWKPDVIELPDINAHKETHKGGKTIHWLIQAAAPAFRRLVAEGEISDERMFLETYFITGKD